MLAEVEQLHGPQMTQIFADPPRPAVSFICVNLRYPRFIGTVDSVCSPTSTNWMVRRRRRWTPMTTHALER
jgi:hypothetical protein